MYIEDGSGNITYVRGRNPKGFEKREKTINLRISETELAWLDQLVDIRKGKGRANHSRIDVIMLYLNKADLSLL